MKIISSVEIYGKMEEVRYIHHLMKIAEYSKQILGLKKSVIYKLV